MLTTHNGGQLLVALGPYVAHTIPNAFRLQAQLGALILVHDEACRAAIVHGRVGR